MNQADVIFVGKVLSATTDAAAPKQTDGGTWSVEGTGDYQTRLMIDVSTVLKGSPPRLVEVVTPTGPCGFIFFVGKTYLVTAAGKGTPVATDVCHGNVTGNAIEFRRTLMEDVLHPKP